MQKINTGVVSYGALALIPYDPGLKDLLTRQDKFGNPYTLYQHTAGQPYAYVPRGVVHKHMTQAGGLHLRSNPVAQSIAVVPPRHEEQAGVIQASFKLLQDEVDHVVEAPTGFGKTYVGGAVAGLIGEATLIIVTKNDLVGPWKDTLSKLIGVPVDEIGHVQQKVQKYKGCRFVVAMIQSLLSREYDADFYQHFGLVIFDEVHRLGAEHFAQVCALFPSRLRLGLSATPKRPDGREALIHAHIGPVMVRGQWVPMKPKVLVKRTGWKPPNGYKRDPATGQWVQGQLEVVPGRMANINKAICSDVMRNREIAEFVKSAYNSGRHTLVLSDLIEDGLYKMFHTLVAAGIPGHEIGYYIGGKTAQELEVSKSKKVVLATYQFTSEGTDVPHWDTLAMMTPRANVKQAIGRILRFLPEKRQPVILDLLDDNPVLKSFYMSRLKQYYSVGAEIVEMDL